MVDRGFKLSFLNPKKDTKATLMKFEERLYDHIVLFPQKLKGTYMLTCLYDIPLVYQLYFKIRDFCEQG